MSTTNTDSTWYWYVRKRGRRYYFGLVDSNGDAPSAAYDIEIKFDRFFDEATEDDTVLAVPIQFEPGILKGVAAEILSMEEKPNERKLAMFRAEYEKAVYNAIHFQIGESQSTVVQKPFDMRDDD